MMPVRTYLELAFWYLVLFFCTLGIALLSNRKRVGEHPLGFPL